MTSRERVQAAINHKTPDRVPLDLGATSVTGIHANALYRLRNALQLCDKPVKIWEVFQQLGAVEEDVIEALGVDIVGLPGYKNFIGTKNERYVPYENSWGAKTLISKEFVYDKLEDGRIWAYPQGDRTAQPSLELLPGGYFYNQTHRGSAAADEQRNAREDFKADFGVMSDEEAEFYRVQADRLAQTGKAVIGLLGVAGYGDAALVPGTNLKQAPGVRSMEEWMMAHCLNPDYIHEVFALQTEVALQNLERYKQAVGDKIDVIYMGGTDFGTQNAPVMSVDMYREFYKPYFETVNRWVHENTAWKTFYHSCGAVAPLIEDFIEAGADILNPVQCSAAGMDPQMLKDTYGDRLVFWGGGIDTQHILPFGTPKECYDMTIDRLNIFSKNGGYVFNTIHNIQGNTPVENLVAMYQALADFNQA